MSVLSCPKAAQLHLPLYPSQYFFTIPHRLLSNLSLTPHQTLTSTVGTLAQTPSVLVLVEISTKAGGCSVHHDRTLYNQFCEYTGHVTYMDRIPMPHTPHTGHVT